MDAFLPFVGYVLFPRTPADLGSAVCPACFAPRSAAPCARCGLDLGHPAIAELDAASMDAATALDRRVELIGRIRFETAAAQTASAPPAAPAPQPAAAVAQAPQPTGAVAHSAYPDPATPRRHLSVQVVLLLLGVALLSIGAIFFLVYAFITFGLIWRSIIILTVTLTAFAGATLLHRRSLGASAESVAILAIVLSFLDLFAIRANDLLVVGDQGGLSYWGGALLISGTGFLLWHRYSGLRVPSIAGVASVPAGLALLGAGLSDGLDDGIRTFLTVTALAIGSLVHPLAGRISRPPHPAQAERTVLLSLAIVGLLVAGAMGAVIAPDTPVAPAIALLIVAAIGLAHIDLALRTSAPIGFSAGLAAIGGVSAASAVGAWVARLDDPLLCVSAPLLAAALVALALEFGFRRAQTEAAATTWTVASIAAGGVAVVAALITIGSAIRPLINAFLPGVWRAPPTHCLGVEPVHIVAVGSLAAVLALVAVAWQASGALRARRGILVWPALTLVVIAVVLTGVLWAAVLGWLVLGIVGAAVLLMHPERSVLTRSALLSSTLAATALGYASSWGSEDLWLIGSVGTLVVLVMLRFAAVTALMSSTLTVNALVRGGIVTVAAIVGFVAAATWGRQIQDAVDSPNSLAATHTILGLAVILLGGSAVAARTPALIEARVLFWAALIAAVGAGGVLWLRSGSSIPSVPESLISTLLGAAFVAALVPWLFSRATDAPPPAPSPALVPAPEPIAASGILAPVVAWLFISLAGLIDGPELVAEVAPIVAALLVAAFSATVASRANRSVRDGGVTLVTIVALAYAAVAQPNTGWLVLLLGAMTVLMLAISADGLIGSTSARRHLGWVSLALATAGLSWILGLSDVRDIAAYVLPPAGALLVAAALNWNAARRSGAASPSAPWIALGGLAVAILPIAVTAIDDAPRLVLIAAVSAALLLGGTMVPSGMPLRGYLDSAAIAGGAGLFLAAGGRSYRLAYSGENDLELGIWLACLLLLFTASAIGQARIGDAQAAAQAQPRAPQAQPLQPQPLQAQPPQGPRGLLSQALLAVPLITVVFLGLLSLRLPTAAPWGAFALLLLLAGLHVACWVIDREPFTRLMGWVALALATVVWFFGGILGQLDPLEWGSVPIGAALLLTGAVVLRRTPEARSWRWLAPGILVIILPSLLATVIDQPIWRLVGIGVACILAVVVGAVRRLQAPLVLGAVLVLVHAIRTFAPQILAVYQLTQWWVWAVVGGAIIFFIGFTFEKRKRDVRKASATIAGLR